RLASPWSAWARQQDCRPAETTTAPLLSCSGAVDVLKKNLEQQRGAEKNEDGGDQVAGSLGHRSLALAHSCHRRAERTVRVGPHEADEHCAQGREAERQAGVENQPDVAQDCGIIPGREISQAGEEG